MLAQLLPFLKIAAPVGAVTVMGGGVFYVASNIARNPASKPLTGVYLLVKGTNAADAVENKALTATDTQKTTRNYKCQLTLANSKTTIDNKCALYKLNASTSDEIDLNLKMFDDANLASEKGSVTTSSHHILRVSQAFYKQLSSSTTTDKSIKLVDSTVSGKHFGIVKEISNLNLKKVSDLTDPSINLFLARVKTKPTQATGSGVGSASTGVASEQANPSLLCQISKDLSVACNVYKFDSDPKTSNSLTKAQLSAATSTTNQTDITVDNYVIVELANKSVKVSELKNKVISIKSKAASSADASATAVADIVFDQTLFGKPSTKGTTPTDGVIFPLTPKTTTFLVEKKAPSDAGTAFTSITTTSTKNYRCKFTQAENINYDNSCVLKTFPTTGNVHLYSAITAKTGFNDVAAAISDKDFFLLTIDSNKLFNLTPDWTKNTEVQVTALSTTENKFETFTLLQEVTATKATGITKNLLVKYNSSEPTTNVLPTGKCALVESDTKGVDCSLKNATVASSAVSGFTPNTSDIASIAKPTYFGVEFTEPRNISDFDGSSLYFYSTKDTTTTKITFDIVATLGGNLTAGKVSYYLEAPRTAIS